MIIISHIVLFVLAPLNSDHLIEFGVFHEMRNVFCICFAGADLGL